jgi:hypothetical protein
MSEGRRKNNNEVRSVNSHTLGPFGGQPRFPGAVHLVRVRVQVQQKMVVVQVEMTREKRKGKSRRGHGSREKES